MPRISTRLPRLVRRRAAASRLVLALGVLVALAAACGPSDPPPTSPLADPVTPSPDVTSTPAPLPTFTPTPSDASPLPPDREVEAEHIVGEAISRLAEWTGEPETAFRLLEVEPVEWPNACIGVEIPDIACAEVITPGYRIAIYHAGRPNGPPYLVHASATGRYAWMPAFDAVRVVESVSGNLVTFEAVPGSDEMGRLHRAAPGSLLEPALSALSPGDRVHVAITWPLPGEDPGLIVWLVPPGPDAQ
jgi:hypothetical protein